MRKFFSKAVIKTVFIKSVKFAMWAGRMVVEAAELIVKAKRALDEVLGNSAWRRPWGVWQRPSPAGA